VGYQPSLGFATGDVEIVHIREATIFIHYG
jgi:hypothetical protein